MAASVIWALIHQTGAVFMLWNNLNKKSFVMKAKKGYFVDFVTFIQSSCIGCNFFVRNTMYEN